MVMNVWLCNKGVLEVVLPLFNIYMCIFTVIVMDFMAVICSEQIYFEIVKYLMRKKLLLLDL